MFRTAAFILALTPSAALAQLVPVTPWQAPPAAPAPPTQVFIESAAPAAPTDPHTVQAKRCGALESIWRDDTDVCRVRAVAADRKAVTDLIADGRCDEAIRSALRLGDLQFAAQVRDYCGGAAPQPAAAALAPTPPALRHVVIRDSAGAHDCVTNGVTTRCN